MRKFSNRVSRLIRGPAFESDRRRDIFLASYPRSGNTWLRAILFHASIGREPRNLAEIDRAVPDQHFRIARKDLLAPAHHPTGRHIVKTHDPYRFLRSQLDYCDVALIIRDPRDVISSYFRYVSRDMRQKNAHSKTSRWLALLGAIGLVVGLST